MGRWQISAVPANWFFIPDFGLRHNSPTHPASNITVKDDVLLAGSKLEPYIQAQIDILKGAYLEPVFAGPQPTALVDSSLLGVHEAMMLIIKHQPHAGAAVFQVQTYVRLDRWLGIITLTTLEQTLMSVRRDYEQFVRMLSIAPEEQATEQQTTGRPESDGGAR